MLGRVNLEKMVRKAEIQQIFEVYNRLFFMRGQNLNFQWKQNRRLALYGEALGLCCPCDKDTLIWVHATESATKSHQLRQQQVLLQTELIFERIGWVYCFTKLFKHTFNNTHASIAATEMPVRNAVRNSW
jgi:hypothetical protein